MSVDMRRFSYRLDVVRTKEAWLLDARLLALRAAVQRLEELRSQQRTARTEREHVLRSLEQAPHLQFDPGSRASALSFLLALDARIRALSEAHLELERQVQEKREACAECQTRLDQLDSHRRKSVAEYLTHEHARAQFALDGEWLLRDSWSKKQEPQR